MSLYFVIFGVFLFGYLTGIARGRKVSRESVKGMIRLMINQSEQYLGISVVPIRIEKMDGNYFIYQLNSLTGFKNQLTRSDVFLAQGKTKNEAIAAARSERPGSFFYIEDVVDFDVEPLKNEVV